MLEKCCKTCGCPLFEVKGKTLCVVCAENKTAAKETKKAAPEAPAAPAPAVHDPGCTCGPEDVESTCTCGGGEGGLLAEELAMTIHALCERIHNEKDANHVLTLMNAVKAGTEALEILCRL